MPQNKAAFYSSGVGWFDAWIGGGVRRREVIFIGAMPYTGKTHFAAWLAGQYMQEGASVLHFTGEDLLEDLYDYYLKATRSKSALRNVWFMDMQDYAFTVQQAEESLQRLNKESKVKPDIVIFDHMDIMHHSGQSFGDWQDAAGVARELKIFARRNDCIVIALSQAYPKEKEHKGVGRFYRAKIGKSGSADIILMIDNVIDDEYFVSRIKARGRRVSKSSEQKILLVDWDKMRVEETR